MAEFAVLSLRLLIDDSIESLCCDPHTRAGGAFVNHELTHLSVDEF
jgi:hypothetical protein